MSTEAPKVPFGFVRIYNSEPGSPDKILCEMPRGMDEEEWMIVRGSAHDLYTIVVFTLGVAATLGFQLAFRVLRAVLS